MTRQRAYAAFVIGAAFAMPVLAASPVDNRPRLVVVGNGLISTVPDIALLSFTIRGEGPTSDAAVGALVKKQAAITAGLSELVGADVTLTTGTLSILEARDKACDDNDDDDRPRLSSGACSVRGYVAALSAALRVSPAADAGTALGLACRLGAVNCEAGGFMLKDPERARARAEAAAVNDARVRATAIAAAAGKRLGDLIMVEDRAARSRGGEDIVVTARRRDDGQSFAPIVVTLKPEPIVTSATMTVTYAIEP